MVMNENWTLDLVFECFCSPTWVNLPPSPPSPPTRFFWIFFTFLASYWLVILWLFMFFFYKQNDKKLYHAECENRWFLIFCSREPSFMYFFKNIMIIYCNKSCIQRMIYVIIYNKKLFLSFFKSWGFLYFLFTKKLYVFYIFTTNHDS